MTTTTTSTTTTSPPLRSDHGQAIGLILIAVVLIGSIAAAVGLVAARLHDRSAAQAAADAAALAGATTGRRSAAVIAARNGGDLTAYVETVHGADVTVTVTVRVGEESATARASTEP